MNTCANYEAWNEMDYSHRLGHWEVTCPRLHFEEKRDDRDVCLLIDTRDFKTETKSPGRMFLEVEYEPRVLGSIHHVKPTDCLSLKARFQLERDHATGLYFETGTDAKSVAELKAGFEEPQSLVGCDTLTFPYLAKLEVAPTDRVFECVPDLVHQHWLYFKLRFRLPGAKLQEIHLTVEDAEGAETTRMMLDRAVTGEEGLEPTNYAKAVRLLARKRKRCHKDEALESHKSEPVPKRRRENPLRGRFSPAPALAEDLIKRYQERHQQALLDTPHDEDVPCFDETCPCKFRDDDSSEEEEEDQEAPQSPSYMSPTE